MKKKETIKEKKLFTDIIHTGRFYRNKYFVIYYKKNENDSSYPLFGLAIMKKLGNAVHRNKLKRQVRNIIDNNKKLFNKDYLYIIMLRKDVNLLNYDQMNQYLIELLDEENINEKNL